MSDNCAEIIDAIIAQRRKQGLTQCELAAACNLTQSVIARLESKRTVPQLDTLLKILSALGQTLVIAPVD